MRFPVAKTNYTVFHFVLLLMKICNLTDYELVGKETVVSRSATLRLLLDDTLVKLLLNIYLSNFVDRLSIYSPVIASF